MNERIVKLITEADTYAWTVAEKYVARDCCNDGEVNYLWEDAFCEKFAELIVDRMLDITDAHTEVFQTDRDKALIEHIKQSVKQHFGVEE